MSKELDEHLRHDRHDFEKGPLHRDDLSTEPLSFFRSWLKTAIDEQVQEPYACVLSTIGVDSQPKSRVLYVREILDEKLVFYTNYESDKGRELASSAKAALNFFWPALERQVRIEGQVSRIPEYRSDDYFASRPRMSQLGAWTSQQSRSAGDVPIAERWKEMEARFEGKEIPRPTHWGGYGLEPTRWEFWQGRPGRLHDRFVYALHDGEWIIQRLDP